MIDYLRVNFSEGQTPEQREEEGAVNSLFSLDRNVLEYY